MISITINDRELATILAALRLWQDQYSSVAMDAADNLTFIANKAGSLKILTLREIDELCERMNTTNESRIHTKFYKLVTALQEISEEAPKSGMPSISDLPERLYPDSYEAIEGYAFDEGMHMQAEVARRALREVGIEPAEGRTEWYHELEDEPSDDEMEDA